MMKMNMPTEDAQDCIRESAVSEIEMAIGVSREEAEILVEKYW